MRAQSVHDHLSDNGYRNTRTRDAVIQFLASQKYLITVENISESVKVDPVTVYRVMDVLEQLGIVQKIQSHASYVTIPQSLWSERARAILIDQERQKVAIMPYENPRENISPTKTVVELRGHIANNHNVQGQTQDDAPPPMSDDVEIQMSTSQNQEEMHPEDSKEKSDKVGSNISVEKDNEVVANNQEDTIHTEHVDRLHRF